MELSARHSHSALRADASKEPTVADDVTGWTTHAGYDGSIRFTIAWNRG